MKTVFVGVLLVSLVTPAFAQSARAQGGRPQPPNRELRGGPGPADDMSPAQLHQLFDAMLAMQAQKALALDEQQYAQFLTRLTALQEGRRRNQQERMRRITELQRMSSPRNAKRADDRELQERLNALQELESRSAADLRRAYDAIDAVLTPLQQARFRVLEEQIERRKLELVGRARKRPSQQQR